MANLTACRASELSARVSPASFPLSFASLAGSPVFTAQDSQQNAVGGVLLRAPSTLCGFPITPEGRAGLPLLPSPYLLHLCIGSYFRPLP